MMLGMNNEVMEGAMGEVIGKMMEYMMDVITLIVSSAIAFFLARHFGDVAGTKAAIEFEKEKAAKARVAALQSLLNEITIIRALATKNSELVHDSPKENVLLTQSVLRMPVTAFETAFLLSESSLLDERSDLSSELLAPVKAYLTEAYSINALIDIHFGLVGGVYGGESIGWKQDVIRNIKRKCKGLKETLDRLENCLKDLLK
jgi:hypothetical protein